jgi:sn-glycerol 3-phosphate transport system permease protein
MTAYDDRLSKDLVNDFRRNRDARLSTRQWLELITEPVVSLLLLSAPLVLIIGRYGMAGRVFVLVLIAGFLATIALPMVSVASIWLFLYSPRVGLFNEILGWLGLPLSNWLNGRELALPALFAVYLWKQLGYFALFYLAALQALPVDVLEAAKLDGITLWQKLRFIIWPLVSPTTYFVSTIAVLGALQQIDHVFVLTTGGPNNATNMSLFYVYEQGFKYFNNGIASAMTVILLAVLMTMAILQFVYLERRVHYD